MSRLPRQKAKQTRRVFPSSSERGKRRVFLVRWTVSGAPGGGADLACSVSQFLPKRETGARRIGREAAGSRAGMPNRPLRPAWTTTLVVPEIRGAGALRAHHAGSHGVFWRANLAEQRAFAWRHNAAQDIAAAATLRVQSWALPRPRCTRIASKSANSSRIR